MSCLRCDHCDRIIDTDYDVEAYWGYEPDRPKVRAETVTRTTIDRWLCPPCREPLEEMEDGLELIGKRVCFAHEPQGPSHTVQAVARDGMVTLDDMAGEFAPHLFVLAPLEAELD